MAKNLNDEANENDLKSVSSLVSWKNKPQVSTLTANESRANNTHTTEMAKIKDYMDAMFIRGKYKHKAKRGKSSIQPKLIRQHAEWRYSSLSEPFLNSNSLFKISPRTYEDRARAEQNETLLNYQFNTQMNIVSTIDRIVRDLVNKGTAIVKVDWVSGVENKPVAQNNYKLIPVDPNDQEAYQAQLAKFQNIQTLSQESHLAIANVPEEDMTAFNQYMEEGVVYTAHYESKEILLGAVDVSRPQLTVCNVDDVVVAPNCRGDIQNAEFIVHKFYRSLSDLKKDGSYRNLSMLPNLGEKQKTDTTLGEYDDPIGEPVSKDQYLVTEQYLLWDKDGDGIKVPVIGTYVGDVMIKLDESHYPDGKYPFTFIKYIPRGEDLNSPYGDPDATLTVDNQNVVGAVTRGVIDILAKTASGQRGTMMNALDPVNKTKFRKQEDYEYAPDIDPAKAIHLHTFPEIPRAAFQMIEANKQEADALTGIKAFGVGSNGEISGDSATAARNAHDATARRELSILRRMKEGIVDIGKRVLMLNQVYLPDETVVRLTNEEFVSVGKNDLIGDYDIVMDISTPEDDKAKSEQMGFIMQTLGDSVSSDIKTKVFAQIARLNKMPVLEKDLKNYKPTPDPIVEESKQVELARLKEEVEKEKAEVAKILMEVNKIKSDILVNTSKAKALNASSDKSNLDFVEQETGVTQARNKELLELKEKHKNSKDNSINDSAGIDSKPNGRGKL